MLGPTSKNTVKTVSERWAARSAHRLQKRQAKRKRSDVCLSNGRGVSHQGLDLDCNTWVIVQPSGSNPLLAMITEVCWEDERAFLNLATFVPSSVLNDDGNGGEFAVLDDLKVGEHMCIPNLDEVGLTVVLPVVHEGRVWFVEQA